MRVVKNENYRVEVTPDEYWSTTHQKMLAQCNRIVEEIRRHVDGWTHVDTQWDANGYCEFCNKQWTEDDDKYNGGCCDQDEALQIEREQQKEASDAFHMWGK